MGLNKKDGTLEGVCLNFKVNNKDWEKYSPDGWVTWKDKNYGFTIYMPYDDDLEVEVSFTEQALINILEAIEDKRLGG